MLEQRIGFGRRLGALLLDSIFIGIISYLVGDTLLGLLGINITIPDEIADADEAMAGMMEQMTKSSASAGILAILYFLTEVFMARTPGKMLLGIIIANADGSPAGTDVLLKRFLLKEGYHALNFLALALSFSLLSTIGGLWSLVFFIGCFFALGEKKQALHDQLVKSAVFKASAIK
ncbi:MAG: RDD family protein [Cytophagales bacterium]|nr:RDD family protein [Cytophagales bacterium]